jgi:hypothetical protein
VVEGGRQWREAGQRCWYGVGNTSTATWQWLLNSQNLAKWGKLLSVVGNYLLLINRSSIVNFFLLSNDLGMFGIVGLMKRLAEMNNKNNTKMKNIDPDDMR